MPDQLPLFGFKEMLPRLKLPPEIKKLALEGKAVYDRGDMKGAAEKMRDLRYKLEDLAKRIG